MSEHSNLLLVGWYGGADHGFAMPLFGHNERANTLYVGRCAIPGDHGGIIADFDPVAVSDHHFLPHGQSEQVGVGEPWRDVFIWNDVCYVGTPEALWNELNPFHSDIEARAPLSLLELAIQADREDKHRLAAAAYGYIAGRFGGQRANNWRRQILRQFLETEIRRALAEESHDEAKFRSVAVIEQAADSVKAIVEGELIAALAGRNKLQEVSSKVIALAAALGAGMNALDNPDGPIMPTSPASPTVEADMTSATQVIVVSIGKRARSIVGHISRDLAALKFSEAGGRWRFASNVTELKKLIAEPNSADPIIMLVLDDEWREDEADRLVGQYLLQREPDRGLVVLVPALPTKCPSRLFESFVLPSPSTHYHAVLDSSIARSPFWWGSQRRSLDRRIADIVQLAATACRSSALRRELHDRHRTGLTPILVVGLVPSSVETRRSAITLGSEASWVSEDPKRNDRAILFSVRLETSGVADRQGERQIIAEGRRVENRFAEFANRVVLPLLGSGIAAPSWRTEEDAIPESLRQTLAFPNHCVVYRAVSEARSQLGIAVIGETPTVDSISATYALGWSIARYTDTATIKRFTRETVATSPLPTEMDVGFVQSSESNRRLATRGVDQRDIIRISYDQLHEWLDALPASQRRAAHDQARPMRSAARAYSETGNDHLLTRNYVFGDDPATHVLRGLLGSAVDRDQKRPLRRAADLKRCWSPPPPGLRRYALVDGAVPPIVVELHSREVPIEDLFVIDGDEAVPALFRSRVFRVWAQATLPSASSWMARYSVNRTFGGFPLVAPFRIIGQDGDAPVLVSSGGPRGLQETSREIDRHIARALASHPSRSWKAAHNLEGELLGALNSVILACYDLPSDADDLTILKRLQHLNEDMGEPSFSTL